MSIYDFTFFVGYNVFTDATVGRVEGRNDGSFEVEFERNGIGLNDESLDADESIYEALLCICDEITASAYDILDEFNATSSNIKINTANRSINK